MRPYILSAVAAVLVTATTWAQQPAQPAQPTQPAQSAPAQAQAVAKPPATKAPEGPKPVIEIAQKVQDFGTVPKGDKIHATFEVRNTGKAPLEISQVRPTCGCTVANFDRTVAPGATGKVVAEVDTTGFSGPVSKAVLVFSNDPATPQVNLVIKADVRAFVEVLPKPLIIFRSVLQGEPAVEKVTLVSADGSDFKVVSATASGGPYQIAYRELPEKERVADRKGSQWEVTVSVPANAPEGMLNHKILVKTTSAKAPEIAINVTGAVRPVVQVIPGEINFGAVDGGALVAQRADHQQPAGLRAAAHRRQVGQPLLHHGSHTAPGGAALPGGGEHESRRAQGGAKGGRNDRHQRPAAQVHRDPRPGGRAVTVRRRATLLRARRGNPGAPCSFSGGAGGERQA